jgi:hypothetical protein
VELAVQDQELGQLDVGLDPVLHVLHVLDLLGAQVRQALGQRQGLQALAHLVDDVHLVLVEQWHARALVRLVLGEALGLEHPQRLADRQPAGAQSRGDLLLPDPLPGLDVAEQDRVAQVGGDPLAGRADAVGHLGHANASGLPKYALPSG